MAVHRAIIAAGAQLVLGTLDFGVNSDAADVCDGDSCSFNFADSSATDIFDDTENKQAEDAPGNNTEAMDVCDGDSCSFGSPIFSGENAEVCDGDSCSFGSPMFSGENAEVCDGDSCSFGSPIFSGDNADDADVCEGDSCSFSFDHNGASSKQVEDIAAHPGEEDGKNTVTLDLFPIGCPGGGLAHCIQTCQSDSSELAFCVHDCSHTCPDGVSSVGTSGGAAIDACAEDPPHEACLDGRAEDHPDEDILDSLNCSSGFLLGKDDQGQWWPVTVTSEDSDGVASCVVHDDMGTLWPVVYRDNLRCVTAEEYAAEIKTESPNPNHTDVAEERVTELWHYNPCNGKPIAVRADAQVNAKRTKVVLQPGQVFEVDAKGSDANGILFLRLADGSGYLFDRLPGGCTICFPDGPQPQWWRYEPYNGKAMSVREQPDVAAKRTGKIMTPGIAFQVDEVVLDEHGIQHLHLADGSGWLFDRNSQGVLCSMVE